jgi:hypothetical protein
MMRSGNVDFSCRSSVVKWIYEHDFVSDFAKLDSVKRIQDVSHPSGRGGGTVSNRVRPSGFHYESLLCLCLCMISRHYESLLCLMSFLSFSTYVQVKAKLESRKEKPAARFFY